MVRYNLNGEVKTWVAVLTFVGAIAVGLMGVGAWKSGVDIGTKNAENAQKAVSELASAQAVMSQSQAKVVESQVALTSRIVALDASVDQLKKAVDRLTVTVATQEAKEEGRHTVMESRLRQLERRR